MTGLLGTVLERDGATYRVATEAGEVRAVLQGKAKRDSPRVVVGSSLRSAGGRLGGTSAGHRIETGGEDE